MSLTTFARSLPLAVTTTTLVLAAVTAGVSSAAPAHKSATTAHRAAQTSAPYEDDTMKLPRHTSPYPGVGPARPYIQQIMIGGVVPLKDQALLNKTAYGYLFRGGQQNNNLTMTYTDGRLVFVDSGTASWKWMPKSCTEISVPQGVGASCAIAAKFVGAAPMLIEVWPRLGDDTVDSTALSDAFDVSFLGDRGDDTAYFGAGDNFFNGAQDDDHGVGGSGGDWMRGNVGNDLLDGGAGNDYIVGVDGSDKIYGGDGNDSIYGADGNDTLYAGSGTDKLVCGGGSDTAYAKSNDKTVECETRNAS